MIENFTSVLTRKKRIANPAAQYQISIVALVLPNKTKYGCVHSYSYLKLALRNEVVDFILNMRAHCTNTL